MTKHEILAKNLTLSGYGADYTVILNILHKLSEEELDELAYSMYRTAEKVGMDAFDCDELYQY